MQQWKFIDANIYIKKEERLQINNLYVHLKVLEKKKKKGKPNPMPAG